MSKIYNHLVWLGAGAASHPEKLLSLAEQSTLVEARKSAYLKLQGLASQNVRAYNLLITTDGNKVAFNEYNLTEYSSTRSATNLSNLFPGLKCIKSTSRDSSGISEFINSLKLKNENNALIVDIIDENLALIKALKKSNHLQFFKNIQVQASLAPLYDNAANSDEIIQFLEKTGYLLQSSTAGDPDLPWLNFNLNPLCIELSKKALEIIDLYKKSESINQKLNKAESQLALTKKSHTEEIKNLSERLEQSTSNEKKLQNSEQSIRHQLDEAILQLTEMEKNLILSEEKNKKEIEHMTFKITQLENQEKFRLEKINQLEKTNLQLTADNKSLLENQKLMKDEMIKAEIQINLIKDIIINQ